MSGTPSQGSSTVRPAAAATSNSRPPSSKGSYMVDGASPAMLYARYPGRPAAPSAERARRAGHARVVPHRHQRVRCPVAEAEVRQGVIDVRVAVAVHEGQAV